MHPANNFEATQTRQWALTRASRWGALLAMCAIAACSAGDAADESVDESADLLTGATTQSFQNGVAPAINYAGAHDAYLAQATPTTAHGSATTCRVDGDAGSGADEVALLSWDVSAVPTTSVVRAVTLRVNVTNTSASSYQVFALKRPWSETQTTWNSASTGAAWSTAGAKGASDRGTTVLGTVAARATGAYTVTLNAAGVAVVQGWVKSPSTNYGFVVANASSADAVAVTSREGATASQRPRLSIGYDSAGSTDAGTDSAVAVDSGTPDSGTQDAGGSTGTSTDANLKVAFIGDTATGTSFKSVLDLIKREGADMVMVQGDLGYSGATSTDWFPVIDNAINASWPGSTATVTIPYFMARGNHDTDWANYSSGLSARMAKWGITPESSPSAGNYSVVHRGLKMVMATESETNPTRTDFVNQRLTGDTHTWKICSWHKDQRATNVGPKSDEMGWQIYENCRNHGAIVAQGHSHTYSRSKTITNDTAQTVDATCSDPFNLCVSPGRHIFLDSSLGGVDTRTLDATVSAKSYWASTYSSSFGALFVEFNVDGDPNKARGYFKNVGGTIIDPPASSGKTSFVIQRTP